MGYGSSQLLRFASNIVLTRLLIPEYFGVMALVNAFRQGLELFSDIGIAQNIVRSKRGDDPEFLNTAWSISILRGLLLWAVLVLLAYPISRFYEEPLLFNVLIVISIVTIARGLVSTKIYTLKRHLVIGKVTLFEFASQFVGVVTMVFVAWLYPSIWSLVIGAIVGQTFRSVLSYILFPGHQHKFVIQPEARKEIVSFGRWIFLSSIVMFLADQSDRLILGDKVSLRTLGVYNIAYMFASIPQQVMKQMSFKVIFPIVSKRVDLPRKQLKRKINRQLWKLHSVLILMCLGLAGFGDLIINFLYDSRYQEAAWMMPLLALGSWFSALFFIADPCLLALGKSFYSAQSRVFRLVLIMVGIHVGFARYGILGAIAVVALADLPSYVASQYYLHREGLGSVLTDMKSTAVLVGLIALVFWIRSMVGLGLPFDKLPTL